MIPLGTDTLNLAQRRLTHWQKLATPGAGKPAEDGCAGIELTPGTDSAALMESILQTSAEPAEAVCRVYEAFFPGVTPPMRRLQERAVDWQIDDLKAQGVHLEELPLGVQESSLFAELPLPQRLGRRVTAEGLALLRVAITAERQMQPRRAGQVVLEMGGGMGEMARLLRRLEPAGPLHTHVIVDMPEALCVAGLLLELEFPGEPVLWLERLEQLAGSDLSAWRFVLVPIALASCLAGRKVDLFLDAAPLAGARSTGVTAWGRFAQETVQVDHLVALSRFLNTERPGLAPWRPSQPPGLLQFDARWQIQDWQLEPSYLRCPWMTRLYPRCVQIVARREAGFDAGQAAGRARQLLDDVRDELWVRHTDGDALESTCWDNVLIQNGGMSGSIFKLWESIRLLPDFDNLNLMLLQIDLLQRFEGKIIEETPLYEKMLETVAESNKERQREIKRWLGERYRERRDVASLIYHLRAVLSECAGRRIVCYGAGIDFEGLVNEGFFAGQNIVGLIDDRRSPGSRVGDYEVVGLADLERLRPEIILATSSRYGSILRERARGIVMALKLDAEVR